MNQNVKLFIKKFTPPTILELVRRNKNIALLREKKRLKPLISQTQSNYKVLVQDLSKKEKIKVTFFVISLSTWKLDKVYHLMKDDPLFEPVIIICPYIFYGEERMLIDMNEAYEYFSNKGYDTIRTFDQQTGNWLDVKKVIQPDIVFFTNPHDLTKEEYYIHNFTDTLNCYVPYGVMLFRAYKWQYNGIFNNLLWIAFYEAEFHKKFAQKYAINKGANVKIAGYPGIDYFWDKTYFPKDRWKIKNKNIKRIIWAPHHILEEKGFGFSTSNFLIYYEFFIKLAVKYKNSIQIAFKPHPILKSKLYLLPDFGKEKTDQYYAFWEKGDNTQLEEGDYVDLFLTSDALILDSISFLAEYLCTKKPELFIINKYIRKIFNTFGKNCLRNVYKAKNENDITFFIENTVLQNHDPMEEKRNEFCKKYLQPKDTEFFSQEIISTIKKKLHEAY